MEEEKENNHMEVCTKCGATMEPGQVFCSKCGTRKEEKVAEPPKNVCSKCGEMLEVGQEFCSKCGQKVGLAIEPNVNSAINQFNANVNMNNQKKKNKSAIYGIIGTVVVIVIIAVFVSIGSKPKITLKEVYNEIGGDNYYCKLASDGSYMRIDTNPLDLDDSFSSTAWKMVKAANKALEFTDSLEAKMNETRSIDGRRTESNDIATVSWTYHPDKGLEVLYELKKK